MNRARMMAWPGRKGQRPPGSLRFTSHSLHMFLSLSTPQASATDATPKGGTLPPPGCLRAHPSRSCPPSGREQNATTTATMNTWTSRDRRCFGYGWTRLCEGRTVPARVDTCSTHTHATRTTRRGMSDTVFNTVASSRNLFRRHQLSLLGPTLPAEMPPWAEADSEKQVK